MNEINQIVATKLDEIKRVTLLGVKTMLTIEDCSLITGYCKKSLLNLCNKKKIPHYKRGGMVYFSKQEIEDWMKGTRIPTEEEISQQALTYMACKNLKAKPEANRGR